MAEQAPIMAALAKAQYDLTSAQAWLAEVRRQAAALNLAAADRPVCIDCDLTVGSVFKLAEHRYLQHEGPVPEHWERSENLAAADPSDDEAEAA